MTTFDIISLIPVLIVYIFIPFFFYSQGQVYKGIHLIGAIILLNIIVESIKIMTPTWAPSWFFRPQNACNCNLFNMGGKVGGKPGFPSGHTASATFLWIVLHHYLSKKFPQYHNIIYYGLLLMVIAVMYARYMKECHNIPQLIGGLIAGYIAGTTYIHRFNL